MHELSPLWLSRNVSVVSQEPTLFGRSIKRNIKFGLEGTDVEPTDDEVKEAARLANAASFIEVRLEIDSGRLLFPFNNFLSCETGHASGLRNRCW